MKRFIRIEAWRAGLDLVRDRGMFVAFQLSRSSDFDPDVRQVVAALTKHAREGDEVKA